MEDAFVKLSIPLGMIWSLAPHVKQPAPHKFVQKSLSPQEKFFLAKRSPHILGGRGTVYFIFISFPIFKNFIPNFCGTNYGSSSKTT